MQRHVAQQVLSGAKLGDAPRFSQHISKGMMCAVRGREATESGALGAGWRWLVSSARPVGGAMPAWAPGRWRCISQCGALSAATIVPCMPPARRVLCGDGGRWSFTFRCARSPRGCGRVHVRAACRRMSCSRSVAAVLRAGGAVPLGESDTPHAMVPRLGAAVDDFSV